MPTLSFEGETHQEIVSKVKKWLASQAGDERLSATDTVAATADITKEALRVIAAAAPEPIAQNEVVKALTGMGYKATDATRERDDRVAERAVDGDRRRLAEASERARRPRRCGR